MRSRADGEFNTFRWMVLPKEENSGVDSVELCRACSIRSGGEIRQCNFRWQSSVRADIGWSWRFVSTEARYRVVLVLRSDLSYRRCSTGLQLQVLFGDKFGVEIVLLGGFLEPVFHDF